MNNNQLLKEWMEQYQLTVTDVAERISMSPWTVKNWVRPSMTKGFRRMPDIAITALRMSISQDLERELETPTSDSDLPDLEFLPGGAAR